MHNKIFINPYNSSNKQMLMNYSVPNQLYSIRTKREVQQINVLVNNYMESYKKNKTNIEVSKVEKKHKKELDTLRSILDKEQSEKKQINIDYDILKKKVERLQQLHHIKINIKNDADIIDANNILDKLPQESLNGLIDECIDEKMLQEITNKMVEKIFKK